MSEIDTRQKNNSSNDEIDIFEFCSRIWHALKRGIIGIKDFIVSIIISLIRKSLWIVSFALIGALIGYLWHGVSRPYYSSFLEGNTGSIYDEIERKYIGGVDNTIIIDHINKLDLLTSKSALLAGYLNMKGDDAKNIRSVKAYYGIDVNKDMKPDYIDFKDTYNPKDSTQIRVPSYIYIRVYVYDENILVPLRKGLLKYINDNTYIQELFKIDRKHKQQLIGEVSSEISKIDSLQRSRYRKDNQLGNQQLFVMETSPKFDLFYKDMLRLYAKKQQLEKNVEISDEIITIVQDFTPMEQEENPILSYIIMFGGCFAVVGLFFSLLWQYRKKIWALIKEDVKK